jgi:hypothetical protein
MNENENFGNVPRRSAYDYANSIEHYKRPFDKADKIVMIGGLIITFVLAIIFVATFFWV